MRVSLYVSKITKEETNKGTTYKVTLKSSDENTKMQFKLSEENWEKFRDNYTIFLGAELIFELYSPQRKMSEFVEGKQ